MKVTKAIITAGGRGTRFLPVASAYQKEMVPILNKPQIQYVIEEAIDSGVHEIAVVVREGVDTFERYLEHDDNLWKFLKETGKEDLMDSLVRIKKNADIKIFTQKESDPYGNGTPFIICKDFAAGESVVAMWGDDIMIHKDTKEPTCVQQMISLYEEYSPVAVMSVQKVSREEINRYGSYDYYTKEESDIPYHAKDLIEKPDPAEAPSLYANAARFVLGPAVFEELSMKIEGKDGELWLTDAVSRLIKKGRAVIASPWVGSVWMPVGDPLRWLQANILVALEDDEYRENLMNFIKHV
jgi:UTP--glucose-1-phosphate uridylyltransferase